MSAAITVPVPTDPTLGMELTTGDEIALEATRWLFLAGDMLDPHRKDDTPRLERGGEELANFCLRRTGGFLPRCQLTPLEVWAEWLPIEYFPEGVRPMKIKGEEVVNNNPNGITLINKPLFGYPHFPGELIVDAIGIATGERRGIVEIEALRTVTFGDPEVQRIQQLFFPPDWHVPVELRLVEEQIAKVGNSTSDSTVKSVANDMTRSCEQFRRWAQAIVDIAHSQLDTRVAHQWTYSYTPKIHSLLRQLEIEPRSYGAPKIQDALLQAIAQGGVTPELFAQMEARDANLVNKLGEVMADAIAKVLSARPVEPPPAPKPTKNS